MLLLLLIGLLTISVYLIRRVYTYWQRRGFPYLEPKIPVGCLGSVVKRQRALGTAIFDLYNETKESFIGIYLLFRPALLIRDAKLVRDILVQDFSSFHDRGIYVDEENDPFSGSLFALQGHKWKVLRTKLTPSFTSGKLKGMFPTVDDVGNKMIDHLNQSLPDKGHQEIQLKELFTNYAVDIVGSVVFGLDIDSFKNPMNEFREISRKFSQPSFSTTFRSTLRFLCPNYAVDIIGSVVFGLDIDSFKNPKNEFREISRKLSTPSFSTIFRSTVQFLCPALEKLFIFMGLKEEQVEAMKAIVRQTVEYREKHNINRKDIMQMLIQLRNTGKINVDDNIWDVETAADNLKTMSIESIASQLFLFYVAGFETTASSATFTIYELAQYPELLAKVQQDILDAIEKHDGKITYESIHDMKYLDLCVMETIRKYPALPILNRECTKDFLIPGTDKVIEKGTPIIISTLGIHRDSQYFPEPMKYDPERFLESNQNYDPTAYIPFGDGPRHCIAQRMGMINVKVALAKFLSNYNIEPTKMGEIEFDTFGIPIVPKGGISVKLSKRNN